MREVLLADVVWLFLLGDVYRYGGLCSADIVWCVELPLLCSADIVWCVELPLLCSADIVWCVELPLLCSVSIKPEVTP
jgi:hypothetical protein